MDNSEQTAITNPTRRLLAMREMVRSLSAARDLDTTLDLIANKTTEVMHVDSCTIYLLDPDGLTLRLRATTGLSKRALGRSTLRVGEGMTGHAVYLGAPVFAARAQDDPLFKRVDEADETIYQSLLAVPLVVQDEPIGALNVQTIERIAFSHDDVETLSLIADIAAGALVHAQLHDKQARQLAELQTLAQVSEAVTSPQYLDDILDVVTEMAAQVMKAAACSIFLLDESQRYLRLHSAKRLNGRYGPRPPLELGQGVIGRVAATGEAVYVPDVRVYPQYVGKERAREEGLVSLLAVPLSVRDRVIGVLCCYTAVPTTFSEEQQSLFLTLANQTALAIENAQLITNTAVVREMHHRIKNNLQTVAMLMQLQMAEADRLDTRQVLETNMHRIRSIAAVHEVLSEKGFRLVDVKDVLVRITRATAETMVPPGLQLELVVHGEPLQLPSRAATALALVVNELVQNALEHAFVGRDHGRVAISLGRSAEQFIVLVRDDGLGLPETLTRNLGLEIAQTLVEDDLRGVIKFNRLQSGTEISIRMPRALEYDLA